MNRASPFGQKKETSFSAAENFPANPGRAWVLERENKLSFYPWMGHNTRTLIRSSRDPNNAQQKRTPGGQCKKAIKIPAPLWATGEKNAEAFATTQPEQRCETRRRKSGELHRPEGRSKKMADERFESQGVTLAGQPPPWPHRVDARCETRRRKAKPLRREALRSIRP